jgi:hypothetical protein
MINPKPHLVNIVNKAIETFFIYIIIIPLLKIDELVLFLGRTNYGNFEDHPRDFSTSRRSVPASRRQRSLLDQYHSDASVRYSGNHSRSVVGIDGQKTLTWFSQPAGQDLRANISAPSLSRLAADLEYCLC